MVATAVVPCFELRHFSLKAHGAAVRWIYTVEDEATFIHDVSEKRNPKNTRNRSSKKKK